MSKFCGLVSLCIVFSLTAFAQVVFGQEQIVINEIHYNPDVKTDPAEFIELYNAGSVPVNMAGWSLTDALNYTFPATNIPPQGYLVVAQNPAFLATKYGATGALGPFNSNSESQLSVWGENIVLRNAEGDIVDQVNYKLGFPWPIIGDPPGYSIELVNPTLDNDLGGSWRASASGSVGGQNSVLIPERSQWSYRKGNSEPSAPVSAWRLPGFDDSGWTSGGAPIGYGESIIVTPLSDMSGAYSSVFFRKTFVVESLGEINSLVLESQIDDGAKIWINGTNVLNINMPASEAAYNATATATVEALNFTRHVINFPGTFLVPGTNIIAVQAHNVSLSGSSDFVMDIRLTAQSGTGGNGPTPGRRNSIYTTNAPPQIRQVQHTPEQPKGGEVVKLTAKVTDPNGVASVILHYQIVEPGNYIDLADSAYTDPASWINLPMNDAGLGGDPVASDNVFSVDLPASVQVHRRLIRYRITVTDSLGASVRVPYADDPQPNFAYFVYNGVPQWTGAVQPGAGGANGAVFTVSSNEMARLPTYHLLAKSNTVADATWFSRYGGDSYLWGGTLVYDGKVYDHIRYRMRGGVWRYSMVKNMWKFDFNRGHDFEARDNWGKKYSVPWRKLNLGSCIQQGDFEHRGEQGMFESVGSRFFGLAGVESFNTTFSTFRVIDSAEEVTPGNQYEGDFWGLYLTVEQEDSRFLDEHGLPDSNFYKMEGGTGELNNQGPNGAGDKSDLNYILNNYTGATDQWWRTNWNLLSYYSYQAIVQGIHHFDIAYDKNYFYYYNSNTRLWQVVPWDLDLTWAHNMYDPGDAGIDRLAERILTPAKDSGTGAQSGTSVMRLTGTRPAFEIEFRNRLREIRDLLFNSDQGWKLVDEYASLVRGTTNSPGILDADRSQWDYNPKMADGAYTPNLGKAGQGRYYQFPLESRTNAALKGSFNATVQIMKNYIGIRGELLDTLATDRAIPVRPEIAYTGPSDYPINRLTFQCSHYMSPSNYPFASMRWRLGEVTDTSSPSYNPLAPHKYEIETVWDSGPISVFSLGMTVPSSAVRPGHRYRLRVQFTDSTGRNSSWSQHIEFTCGVQENVAELMNYLRITELMYNPPPGGYEYIELHNFSTTATLDLGGVRFTDGIEFTFPNGTFLGPNAYLVLIDTTNAAAFRTYYKLSESVSLIWAFTKSLDNKGEQVTLKTSAGGSNIVSFTYGDGRGWPRTADGSGNSLILLDSALADQANGSGEYGPNWRRSTYLLGSPGRADPIPPAAPIVLNEIAANTDSTNVFTSNDWIELYNPNDFPVVLGANWYLSDDDVDLKKWMIPSNTVVPARGWISFDEQTAFHNPTNIGFGLSSGGEQVFLSYLPGTEENRIVDFVSFKGQEPGWTLGRYPDGVGNWCSLQPATRDAANTAPPSHVVINELMYHPPDRNGLDNVVDEFVELWNPTQSEVQLWNTNGVWRFDGGLTMAFPTNTVLAAGEYLIVVSFDPGTNAAQLEAFKSLYGITDPAVKILGPYLGKLANSSDRVALEKPQASEIPGNPSWVIVDEVIYADQSPWPCGSDGTGTSLQRVSADRFGNDPLNWTAQAPTPGLPRVPQPPGAPTIVAQPVSASAALNGSAWFDVRVCGTPPYTYQWQFNDADIPNATNSTLVLNNLQITNGGLYTVRVSNEGGSALSAPALLTLAYPPVITLQPLDQVAALGGSASFTVAAEGSAPLRYQWRVNGTNIPGGTNSTLLLDAIKASDQGNYCALVINHVGTAISSNAMLTVLLPPTISRDPQSAIVVGSTNSLTFGQSFSNVTFFVAASGTHPLAYQWRLNGVEIPFATNSFLRITNASIPDEGIYDVTISNIVGIITSAPAPLVISMVPVITLAPEHFTVAAGSTITLSAAAKGNPVPFNFKWTKDGLTVTNMVMAETNCSLLLANIQPSQGGNYQVVVNNSFETNRITTTPRRIVVVVTPPTNQMVVPGQTVNISAVASAGPWTSRVRYQWQFNAANILNATNSVLSLTNFLPTQEGLYTVSVINPSNVIGNFSAQISLDTDRDGMPDAWETAHQFRPGDPSDASADADHDGMTNLQEYTAGTDPLDAQSFLRLDIQAGEGVILRFNAVSNRVYAIEYSDRIAGLWTKLVDVPVTVTNRLFEGFDTSGETNRYYRLKTR